MRKTLFILFLSLLFISGKSYSQTYNYGADNSSFAKGYIQLKDGRILNGKYIYSVDLTKIQIVTKEETLVLDADEVEKITKDNPAKQKKEKEQKTTVPFEYEPLKIFNITDLGLLIGNPDNEMKNPLIVHTSFNYTFYKNLSAGLGTGLEFYKETYLPVIANVMYKLGGRRVTPYVMLQGGYNIPLTGTRMTVYEIIPPYVDYRSYYPVATPQKLSTKGGFLLNPSVGFIYQLSEGFGLGFSLGYRYHTLNYTSDNEYTLQTAYNRLSMKLSFIFN